MQLTEFCRKLETIEELVLPFQQVENGQVTAEGDGGGDAIVVKGRQEEGEEGGGEDASMGGDSVNSRDDLLDKGPSARHAHGFARDNAANAALPPPYQSTLWNQENGEYVSPSDRLAKFYRIYNKVLLDSIAIDKEKQRLQEENAQLEDLIAQYLDGLQLNQRVLEDDNPLFVVNGRYVLIALLSLFHCVSERISIMFHR